MPNCKQCSTGFEITERDREFYRYFKVNDPEKCPRCRQQQRLMYRNERHLYHRQCDLTGKKIISMYSADKPFKVYDHDVWQSDQWEATEYARDFDFSRPFFEQFYELQKAVPRMPIINVATQNSSYVNYAGYCKNCYLIFGSIQSEDCYYGSPYYCKNCVDIERLNESEFCYGCVDSKKLYHCVFLQNSGNCSDCLFGFDLQGCQYCFGCVGLRQKKYTIFNQPYSKEDYEHRLEQFNLKDPQHFEAARKKFDELKLKTPHLSNRIINSENCFGDFIDDSKNCFYGFYLERAQDCRYVNQLIDAKNAIDHDYSEELEWCYNAMGGYRLNNIFCCLPNVESADLIYCDHCFSTQSCFGCAGLKRKKYCILNKQYDKSKYQDLKSKIIEHMKSTGEWGQFFPAQYSFFAYNESLANEYEYYPLTREEVLKYGWKWREKEAEKATENVTFDDNIHTCLQCHKPFRFIVQERKFYDRMNLTPPQKCWHCRYQERIRLRNPRRLFGRSCARCRAPIQTTYSSDRPEIVYCEACYLKEVY